MKVLLASLLLTSAFSVLAQSLNNDPCYASPRKN
jgi:hypothetical protein